MFVGIHSTKLGPAAGGTRMRVYASPRDALEDCLRLARGMTRKFAVVGLPCGGGKAVLAVPALPTGAERERLMRRYGRFIATLASSFGTGEDMNIGERDIDLMGEEGAVVFCRSVAAGGSGDPSPSTARGVFHGIRASIGHAFGTPELRGRRVLVQGTGAVGARLVELLAEAGADILVSDIDGARASAVAARVGGSVVPVDAALTTGCDVLAPCAIGGILDESTIPRLACRVVAGAANNQLRTSEDGARLRSAGILYAPDYVINAGGVLHGYGLERLGWDRAELERRLAGIGETLLAVYTAAHREGIDTHTAAERIAAARLREGAVAATA